MIKIIDKKECCGCGACNNICPVDAIKMKLDQEGFPYPQIDAEKCIHCDRCTQVCPILHKTEKQAETLRAFACYATDDELRKRSTSGGLFATIGKYFIEELKGTVYGVKFDKEHNAVYCSTNKQEGIICMQGSKYVQADTGKTYYDIKSKLEEQQYVLFSGLPCQVEALKCFLKKEYETLYTIDIVCFGIASPGIWRNYLENFHNLKKITYVTFKDKIDGWKNWKVKFIEDGKEKYYDRKTNLYMNSYLQRINVRPSCFQCKFKGLHRNSDFSIGDCWGIGEKNKNLNDDKGLSALLIHTHKGQELFEKIKMKLKYEEYVPEELMERNWAVNNSPAMNEKRGDFFDKLDRNNFKSIFTDYFGN